MKLGLNLISSLESCNLPANFKELGCFTVSSIADLCFSSKGTPWAFLYDGNVTHIPYKFLSMGTFIDAQCLCLRNKVTSILRIVIRPAMNFGNLARPVAMSGTDRRCPFERRCTPWVSRHYPSALENGVEEVEDEQELNRKYDHRYRRNEPVQSAKLIKRDPVAVIKVTTRHTGQTFIVHRP